MAKLQKTATMPQLRKHSVNVNWGMIDKKELVEKSTLCVVYNGKLKHLVTIRAYSSKNGNSFHCVVHFGFLTSSESTVLYGKDSYYLNQSIEQAFKSVGFRGESLSGTYSWLLALAEDFYCLSDSNFLIV